MSCTGPGLTSTSHRTPAGYDLIQGLSFTIAPSPRCLQASDGGEPAVDGKRLTGNEGAGVRREQRRHALQVFRAAAAPHRGHPRGPLPIELVGHLGREIARRNPLLTR